MGFAGERGRTNVHGLLPEHGAIFMSNTRTKRVCLRKKLFGLPSSLAEFVKNVKAGMFLFLFEYEKRELHGVFKAASDGEIDIVPAAYGSSGKRFPAQVITIDFMYYLELSFPFFFYSFFLFIFWGNLCSYHKRMPLFPSHPLVRNWEAAEVEPPFADV